MKKLLAIVLAVVMLFSVMVVVGVSGETTYTYNTVQNFDGFAENEINRSGNHIKNEKGIKTKLVKSGSSIVTTKGNASSSTGEFIAYGKDGSMGFKAWSNASGEYIEVYVPVTAEMRQGAVGFRVWAYNRSITISGFQLRFYAQKDGVEYVYRKSGYTMDKLQDGYLELFFNDPEIGKHSQTPSYTNVADPSKVPDVSSYNMSEDLTYIGVMVSTTSTGAMGFDNFEIISSDAPAEEDTTVPEEETTVPTEEETTSTTVAPQDPSEEVEIIAGGEWVEGFWRNGVIDTSTTEASNNKRVSYNVFLKVTPNTTYTITTKLNRNSTVANAINFKEYDADKNQLSATNFQAYSLGTDFTKEVTVSATTEYITISLWSSFDSTQTGTDLYKNILNALANGNIAVSIKGVVAVGEPEVAIAMVQGAGVRFNEVTGMRYKATIDTAAVDEYIAQGYTVTMGTLIAPADKFASYEGLTFQADANNFLDVVTTGYFDEDKGTIAGSISNIREANYGRNFIARSYVKLTKDDETYVSYATANDNTRSIKTLANAVLDDDTMIPENEAQIELLNKWAAASDWKA